ncbi:hypothetical protein [Candidatus Uabimicrobium sp. HlEnr_7]|uniref:hypothetical protein n=1 Tax=Candidatus Uabimicrobium helgolandensis TaxID=3095367 RepID=UPI00355708A5
MKINLRIAARNAMIGVSIYTIYYLLSILGVALEIQDLVDLNPSMAVFIQQFGYIRVMLLPTLVYIPLIIFLYAIYQR